LRISSLLNNYVQDSLVQTVVARLQNYPGTIIGIKGLMGSMDALVASAVTRVTGKSQLFVLKDKEQAAYFQNDLQNLLETEVQFYPTSYKKPYQYQETENANVLMRAEIINRALQAAEQTIYIVTYPEALCEKVINKQSLVSNTLNLKVGSDIELNRLNDQLQDYGFERTDFVYEAGQFSIRGGIVDIFSYANDLPFRLEFLGSEIESIRTFDPINQLSIDPLQSISIIPNVETRLVNETRQSFFEFLPEPISGSRIRGIYWNPVRTISNRPQKSLMKNLRPVRGLRLFRSLPISLKLPKPLQHSFRNFPGYILISLSKSNPKTLFSSMPPASQPSTKTST